MRRFNESLDNVLKVLPIHLELDKQLQNGYIDAKALYESCLDFSDTQRFMSLLSEANGATTQPRKFKPGFEPSERAAPLTREQKLNEIMDRVKPIFKDEIKKFADRLHSGVSSTTPQGRNDRTVISALYTFLNNSIDKWSPKLYDSESAARPGTGPFGYTANKAGAYDPKTAGLKQQRMPGRVASALGGAAKGAVKGVGNFIKNATSGYA